MLYWSVIFFMIALVAGLFGFGGIATTSVGIAQVLFYLFLFIFILSVVIHLIRSVFKS